MGNPTSYRGHSLEWGRIRLLTKRDDTVVEYNANGMRTRKGDTYYELDGDNIISETTNGSTIRYYYGNGGIVGFRYNGSRYYYEKNLMGDIVAIYDECGNKVGGYFYDAWGNCTITTDINNVANVNPFRYRGYYYDSDLGLYYLKSRYYDAAVGRFINADEVNCLGANGDLCAYNLFAYCGDNPVNCEDFSGNFVISSSLAAAVAVAAAKAIIATVATIAVCEIASTAIEEAYVWVEEQKQTRSYSVYFLQDEEGIIRYVGRVTDEGYDARMKHHYATKKLTPAHRVSGLSYEVARGLEEIGMIQCHTLNAKNPVNNKIHGNKIHGISEQNKNGESYMKAA